MQSCLDQLQILFEMHRIMLVQHSSSEFLTNRWLKESSMKVVRPVENFHKLEVCCSGYLERIRKFQYCQNKYRRNYQRSEQYLFQHQLTNQKDASMDCSLLVTRSHSRLVKQSCRNPTTQHMPIRIACQSKVYCRQPSRSSDL